MQRLWPQVDCTFSLIMTDLLLSRAISRMYPDAEQVIRMIVCVNQRNALKVPMARHSLVGGASLEYNDNISSLPISKQAGIFREMLKKEITDEEVLKGDVGYEY